MCLLSCILGLLLAFVLEGRLCYLWCTPNSTTNLFGCIIKLLDPGTIKVSVVLVECVLQMAYVLCLVWCVQSCSYSRYVGGTRQCHFCQGSLVNRGVSGASFLRFVSLPHLEGTASLWSPAHTVLSCNLGVGRGEEWVLICVTFTSCPPSVFKSLHPHLFFDTSS